MSRTTCSIAFNAYAPPQEPVRALLGLLVQRFDQDLRRGTRRRRILAGGKQAVGDDMNSPIAGLGEVASQRLQFILDEEGDNLRQADRFFLGVGEAGDLLAL